MHFFTIHFHPFLKCLYYLNPFCCSTVIVSYVPTHEAVCYFNTKHKWKQKQKYIIKLEMWANAQRDGRRVKYRWRPLFNVTKFGWRPLLEYRAVMLPRRETRWNLLGCPKLGNSSQPLLGRSSPYYEDMWRRYWCLTSYFPIVDTCLSCKAMARQSCAMVPRWRFFASCIFSEQRAAHFTHAF